MLFLLKKTTFSKKLFEKNDFIDWTILLNDGLVRQRT